ncbi:hypothetical protein [Flavobacterium sp. NKUCC04_CG]|uniref:hypothetical protein n=1 Tax=Flavobacterium sp. NKUCC04_CG TaxID=2842121 RepID=UPI001C5BD48E|nr:hypothetical protein [Flavobacterium sp. NKUCC04_CG]MBW3520298.1 hypothetical protein [Flavobacterium sp. NKUCC04_CG]
MKKTFYCLFLLLYLTQGYSQDHIMQISPKCGQEKKIVNSFSQMGLKQKEIYVLHFRPAACPRCESGIWISTSLLKAQNKEVVLIVDGENQKQSTDYLNSLKGINLNDFSYIIYDTSQFFRTLIDYQATFNLSYPLLHKINIEVGFFHSINPLSGTAVNSESIISIIDNTDIQKCIELTDEKQKDKTTKNTFWDHEILLNSKNLVNPREINANRRFIYLTDATTNHVIIYDSNGEQVYDYYPEALELMLDIKEDTLFRKKIQEDLIDSGIARVIYLNAYTSEHGLTTIPSSVPNIWYEGETAFYANTPLFIEKQNENTIKNIIRFETSIDFNDSVKQKSPLVAVHDYYKPFFENYFAFPLIKGWPAQGFELDLNNSDNNPFDTKFYNNSQVLRVYKNNLEYLDIGQLAKIYTEKKLGYFYQNSFYTSSSTTFYLFDKLSGEVQIFDKKSIDEQKNIFKTVQLFPEKITRLQNLSPQISNNETKLNLLTPFKPILTETSIWDVKTDNKKNVCILIKDNKNNQLIYRKYNSKMTKLLLEKKFELENSDILVSATIQCDINNNATRIIGIEKITGSFYFKFKNLTSK